MEREVTEKIEELMFGEDVDRILHEAYQQASGVKGWWTKNPERQTIAKVGTIIRGQLFRTKVFLLS